VVSCLSESTLGVIKQGQAIADGAAIGWSPVGHGRGRSARAQGGKGFISCGARGPCTLLTA